MSSILEALRKSDQNRPNGDSPSVKQIQFGENRQEVKSKKGFYLLVLFLLLVAGGLWAHQSGWLDPVYGWFDSADEVETNTPEATGISVANQPQNPTVNTLTPPKPDDIKQQAKAQASKQVSQEASQGEQSLKTQTKEQQDQTEPTDQNSKSVVDQTNDFVAPDAGNESKPISEKGTSKDVLQTKNDVQPLIEPSIEPANDEDLVKAVDVPEPKPAAVKQQAYLLFHQLPYAVRKDLPSIRMNIHMFDPNPDNRMVILNGERFNIGDEIEGVAKIKDIVAEGVVVEVGATVFMIPK